jgi:lysozyme family protein
MGELVSPTFYFIEMEQRAIALLRAVQKNNNPHSLQWRLATTKITQIRNLKTYSDSLQKYTNAVNEAISWAEKQLNIKENV